MLYTYFHWGVQAWATYIVVGLALAYFAFRHNLPLTMRSAFYPCLVTESTARSAIPSTFCGAGNHVRRSNLLRPGGDTGERGAELPV